MVGRQSGFTLLELLTVAAIIGIAVSIGALFVRPLEGPLQSGTVLTEGFLRQVRARAMSTTSSYRVAPSGPGTLVTAFADGCAAASWTDDPAFSLELPRGVKLEDTTWALCFSSRGFTDSSLVLTLRHNAYGTRRIEVLRGGTTRVLP